MAVTRTSVPEIMHVTSILPVHVILYAAHEKPGHSCLSAPSSCQASKFVSHLMEKRVDLLQITDAENSWTQLGCASPISRSTGALARVNVMRVGRGISGNRAVCWEQTVLELVQ